MMLDIRNDYEYQIGHFDVCFGFLCSDIQGAINMKTKHFVDTFGALDTLLMEIPKEKPLMIYCTGGIRCESVGAYLTQKKGFKNVYRLEVRANAALLW
jgi:UPF0176 protein